VIITIHGREWEKVLLLVIGYFASVLKNILPLLKISGIFFIFLKNCGESLSIKTPAAINI